MMEVAHSDNVETDGISNTQQPPDFMEQLAAQHTTNLEADPMLEAEPESCVDTGDDLGGSPQQLFFLFNR